MDTPNIKYLVQNTKLTMLVLNGTTIMPSSLCYKHQQGQQLLGTWTNKNQIMLHSATAPPPTPHPRAAPADISHKNQ